MNEMMHIATVNGIEVWGNIPCLGDDLWIKPESLVDKPEKDIRVAVDYVSDLAPVYQSLWYFLHDMPDGCTHLNTPFQIREVVRLWNINWRWRKDNSELIKQCEKRMTELQHSSESITVSQPNDKQDHGHVYLIGNYAEEVYKIGMTRNGPVKRCNIINTKLPYPVEIIHTIETEHPIELEAELHEHFKNKHVNGEWFRLDDIDIETIKTWGIE